MKYFNWNSNIEKDMNSVYERLEKLEKAIDGFYSPYNDMFSKVNGLYKGDKHGTLRPKVDILDDDVFRDISSIEDNVYDLQEKVEKLEKKK